jgi:hypothetical protein
VASRMRGGLSLPWLNEKQISDKPAGGRAGLFDGLRRCHMALDLSAVTATRESPSGGK